MSKQNKASLINQVEQLKQLLKDLKLDLATLDKSQTELRREKDQLQVGDRVTILNPRRGQPSRGTLARVNTVMNRGTVLVRTPTGREIRIVRHTKNLSAVQE